MVKDLLSRALLINILMGLGIVGALLIWSILGTQIRELVSSVIGRKIYVGRYKPNQKTQWIVKSGTAKTKAAVSLLEDLLFILLLIVCFLPSLIVSRLLK